MAQSSSITATLQEKMEVTLNVEQNPGGLLVTVKYRWPYAIAVVTDSVVRVVAVNRQGWCNIESGKKL